MRLYEKTCVPCEDSSIPRLSVEEAEKYNQQIQNWYLQEVKSHLQISKEFRFRSFKDSINFVNKVADLAEDQKHHPNILITYSKVKITLFTHVINGLHENDFVMASKIDRL